MTSSVLSFGFEALNTFECGQYNHLASAFRRPPDISLELIASIFKVSNKPPEDGKLSSARRLNSLVS
jgi:hypothetical protein